MKKVFLFIFCALLINAVKSEAQLDRWYSYGTYSQYKSYYTGGDVGYSFLPIWNDTTAQYGFNDIYGSPQYSHVGFTSVGMSFAPRLNAWDDPAISPATIKVGPSDVYVIDSVRLYGQYERNNAKTVPVDTLRLGFVYGNGTSATNITTGSLSGGPYGAASFIDMYYDSIKNVAGKSLTSSVAPYYQDIRLSATDTATTFIRSVKLSTPFTVPAGNFASMSMSFKSGDASYIPNDTIIYPSGARKYGAFTPFIQYKTMYTGGPVDYAMYDAVDSNVGFFEDRRSSPYGWAGVYVPTWAWTAGGGASALQYPLVDFHVTCPACELNDTITGTKYACAGGYSYLYINYTGGTWSSSNTLIATVSSSGFVNALSPGIVQITYMLGGHKTTSNFEVQTTPVAGPISGPSTICTGTYGSYTGGTPGGYWYSSNTYVANFYGSPGDLYGLATGTTTIEYTIYNACGSDYAYKTITVIPAPFAGYVTGTYATCEGTTTIFYDSEPGGTWSSSAPSIARVSPSGVVTGVKGGYADIIYTVSNVCGSVSATSGITIDPLPNVGTITAANTLCVNTNITLSDNVPGGIWSSTSGHTLILGNAAGGVSVGVDTILYTVANDCGTKAAKHVVTVEDCPTAINDVHVAQDINIHPNPAQDKIIITSSLLIKNVVVSNMVGETVVSEAYNTNNAEVNLSQLPSGVYMVKVNNSNVYKVVKQ